MSALAYWDGEDHTQLSRFVAEWSSAFPSFRIFGDRDVIPLLEQYFPEHVELYRAIRIPAAKADVARLILLYQFGGLYVDCHVGIRDKEGIRRLLASLDEAEAIFFDRAPAHGPRPPDGHVLINSIILSRPCSTLVLMMARQALSNLAAHREFECLVGHLPYSIGLLSGPGVVQIMVLQPESDCTIWREIRWDYRERIRILKEEEAPMERYRHRSYYGPGQHWFERQKVELLFEKQSNPIAGRDRRSIPQRRLSWLTRWATGAAGFYPDRKSAQVK